jgi:hypothetical protein
MRYRHRIILKKSKIGETQCLAYWKCCYSMQACHVFSVLEYVLLSLCHATCVLCGSMIRFDNASGFMNLF